MPSRPSLLGDSGQPLGAHSFTPHRVVCEKCRTEGERSTVHIGIATRTLMAVQHYYDESGNYVVRDPNKTTTTYRCSRGHQWTETR